MMEYQSGCNDCELFSLALVCQLGYLSDPCFLDRNEKHFQCFGSKKTGQISFSFQKHFIAFKEKYNRYFVFIGSS